MNTSTVCNWLRLLAVFFTCTSGLMACAGGPEQQKNFSYSVTMDVRTDVPVYEQAEVKVLDYSYGIANKLEVIPSKWMRANFPSEGCCGIIHQGIVAPRGDYLYFKWRVLATGEVFEDKVDLSTRLPKDMNNRRLYIAIFGSQLYVYLFPPQSVKQLSGLDVVIAGLPPARVLGESFRDTLRESDYARRHQIYPNVVKR